MPEFGGIIQAPPIQFPGEAALSKHEDPVRKAAGLAQTVRNRQNRVAVFQLQEQLFNLGGGAKIERGGGFIKE